MLPKEEDSGKKISLRRLALSAAISPSTCTLGAGFPHGHPMAAFPVLPADLSAQVEKLSLGIEPPRHQPRLGEG